MPAQEIALLALPALPAGPTCTKPKTVSVNKNCKRKAWNLHQTQVKCFLCIMQVAFCMMSKCRHCRHYFRTPQDCAKACMQQPESFETA